MCGILAAYQSNQLWGKRELVNALHTIELRGPDAWDCWLDEGLFLGHRRLAIIDLATGQQPMKSVDGRFIIIFNGEIYNYRDLRSQLRARGHQFATLSDTEVILESYRRWGRDCVRQLSGMYAFVLWDKHERVLFAARDRLGIKPMCWRFQNGNLLIASTLAPLMALSGLDYPLDYQAVRDVLVYDYVPSPRTMIQGIHKLPPGHTLSWRPGAAAPEIELFWNVPGPKQDIPSQEELNECVEALLDASVERQMVSDVPLGAFLSGGLDSSLIVALMARHSSSPVKTFSVRFKQGSDESPIAFQVAQAFATDHTVLDAEDVSGEDLLNILTQIDEPISDPALIPTVALSRLTKQHVTVALSGDGGDEIFGGYPRYLSGEERHKNCWYPWLRPAKWMIDRYPGRPPGRSFSRLYWRSLSPHERIPFGWAKYGLYPVFGKDLHQILSAEAMTKTNPDEFFDTWSGHAARWGKVYDGDTLMRVDLVTYLSENCLFKTDRASMMGSLEVRVPFLDDLILDTIVPLPVGSKIVNGQLKALLQPMARKLLPREVWNRPKHGFTVPIDTQINTLWHDAVQALLAWGKSKVPIFNYSYLDRLVKINQHSGGIGRELWNPVVILAWLYARQGVVTL